MKLRPNIDRKGRIARAVSGLVCIAVGVTVLVLKWPEAVGWRWAIGVTGILSGLFQLFEAKRAWCVVRACGVKTPM